MANNPALAEDRARRFIGDRSHKGFPISGIEYELLIHCMAAFAAGEVSQALKDFCDEVGITYD